MRKLFTRIMAGIVAAVMMLGSMSATVHAETTTQLNINYHCGDTKIEGATFILADSWAGAHGSVFVLPQHFGLSALALIYRCSQMEKVSHI